MMNFDIGAIEKKIGYTFKNKALLEEAFTHSTFAHTYGVKSNERLEYLGDAVLQFIITDYQFKKYPKKTEGELTLLRQKLVCEDALFEEVDNLDVAQYLLTAGSEANVGKKTIASLFETLVAALYLDGGYEVAKTFVLGGDTLVEHFKSKDAKTQLQEFLQSIHEEPPVYEEKSRRGKDNDPIFVFEAKALGKTAKGEGKSKKQAQQEAAGKLLIILKSSNYSRKK